MGFFNKKNEPKKEVVKEVEEEETMVEEYYTCDNCGKEYKESELVETDEGDNFCKACVKKQKEKELLLKDAQETYAYTFGIEFMNDEETENRECTGITKELAQGIYDAAKNAIKNKEDFLEIPLHDYYDSDEEEIKTNYPDYIRLSIVKRIYTNKEDEE